MALLLLLWVACIHTPVVPARVDKLGGHPERVLVHDVRVFGPGGMIEHQDVLLDAGRIASVSPTGTTPRADRVVAGAGRTLLPGLVDLHVHMALSAAPPWYLSLPTPRANAEAMAYAGITTVLDVGGNPDVLRRLKQSITAGRLAGPRIFCTGRGLTVAGGYPLDMVRELYGPLAFGAFDGHHYVAVTSPEDIERRVEEQARAGATFIKLVVASIPPGDPPAPRLSEAEVVAAVNRAHALGLRVAAHIDTAEDALLCARVGVDLLAHGVETSHLTEADLETLRVSGIVFSPTLVNWQRFDDLTRFAFQPTALEQATQPSAILDAFSPEALHAREATLAASSFSRWADALEAHREDRIANTRRMWAAGVPLLVGSDSQGSIGTFPGSLHQELRLLVEAGIPPEAVLRQATRSNALFLDPEADWGEVAPGRFADLLLVEGDPSQDIGVTEHIVEVWVGGVPVHRR